MRKLSGIVLFAAAGLLAATGCAAPAETPERTFVIRYCTRDIGEFEKVAALAELLKPHGRVEFNVSGLAEKSRYDVPEGGSPWHEYASYNSTPCKFFPPARLAPFIPAEHVAKNQQMLRAKLAILRRHGFGAAFWANEPNFLPEAFYRACPELRGPRCDHPRRSRQEAFAPCVDRQEVLDMEAQSVAELVRNVPELRTYYFKTNDAGSGFCWSYWLYSGPNGPSACRERPMGRRLRGFVDAINRGAAAAGGKLDIHLSGLFSDPERDDILASLPPNAVLGDGPAAASIATGVNPFYPVRGIVNPVGTLRSIGRLRRGGVKTVFVELRASYDRGGETPEAVRMIFEMVDECLREPAPGAAAEGDPLRRLCAKWGGARADDLYGALVDLDEALKFQRASFPGIKGMYAVVSARHINRPLVAIPENLSAAEEAYFLPHVFNKYESEARTDYIDIHGDRLAPAPTPPAEPDPRLPAVDEFRSKLDRVAERLEHLDGAPEAPFFRAMALSLRIYGSLMRSSNNFYACQIVRDRNREKLAGPERIPAKVPDRTGDPDLLLLNAYMRDELDNAQELIRLLEAGGLDRLSLAKTPADEDTFLLGPDLLRQLATKREIMRRHWLDAQKVMTPPNK